MSKRIKTETGFIEVCIFDDMVNITELDKKRVVKGEVILEPSDLPELISELQKLIKK